MFTDTAPVTVELLADDHCSARVFMVGGGGISSYSGAGSGYLKYSSVPLTETTTVQIQVGDQWEASSFTIGEVTLEAARGESDTRDDDGTWHGGNGYSGGGGLCSCNGGSGGGDGACEGEKYLGGLGTGEHLSSFPMDSFILTPGFGGQYYSDGHGGGGGGVLINGAGPEEWDTTQGQGYGGGGCKYDSQGNKVNIGLRGVILIEMVP